MRINNKNEEKFYSSVAFSLVTLSDLLEVTPL